MRSIRPNYLFQLFFELEVLLGKFSDFGVDVSSIGSLTLPQGAAQSALPDRRAHALFISRGISFYFYHLKGQVDESF